MLISKMMIILRGDDVSMRIAILTLNRSLKDHWFMHSIYQRNKAQHVEYKTNTFGSAETEQEFYHKCLIFSTVPVKQSNQHSGHFILDNSKD